MNLPTTPVPSNEFPWVSCKEGYGLLTLEIDVQKVRDLMGSHPFPQGVVAVKDLKGILGLTYLEPRDAEINLKVPLLLVECPGDYGTLLVDGYPTVR